MTAPLCLVGPVVGGGGCENYIMTVGEVLFGLPCVFGICPAASVAGELGLLLFFHCQPASQPPP